MLSAKLSTLLYSISFLPLKCHIFYWRNSSAYLNFLKNKKRLKTCILSILIHSSNASEKVTASSMLYLFKFSLQRHINLYKYICRNRGVHVSVIFYHPKQISISPLSTYKASSLMMFNNISFIVLQSLKIYKHCLINIPAKANTVVTELLKKKKIVLCNFKHLVFIPGFEEPLFFST